VQIRSEKIATDPGEFPSLDQVRAQLRRPLSLSCLGWLVLLVGACAALDLVFHDPARWPIWSAIDAPGWFPYAIYGTAPVFVACGVGFLNGWEWARILWLSFSVAMATLIGFVVPVQLPLFASGIAAIGLFSFLLFRPAANDYFVAVSSQNDPLLR
jgi:hypothetical protein